MTARKTNEQFLLEVNKKHNHQYEYMSVYEKVNIKIKIKHKKCGFIFMQSPDKHLFGRGCPKCGGSQNKTHDQFIIDAKSIHNDEYEYLSKYKNAHTKIKMRHRKCNFIFIQMPNTHLNGSGCPECAKNIAKEKIALTNDEFLFKAREIHGDDFEYLSKYIRSKQDIKIKHKKCGKIFYQSPNSHLRGSGCGGCAYKQNAKIRARTNEEFILEANIIHNNEYEYISLYERGKNKIEIKHIKCGKNFFQSPLDHLGGHGCKNCAYKKMGKARALSKEQFIEKAIAVHGYRYNYELIEYENHMTHVKIICSIHGLFNQTPNNHLAGDGCNKCGNLSTALKQTHSFNIIINKANIKHNFLYLYPEQEYKNTCQEIIITCKEHGNFNQLVGNHLRGAGCPKCVSSISKLECDWLNFIGIIDDKKHRQTKIIISGNKRFKVDGFDPINNTIYEFYGDYWHGNPKVFDQEKIHPIIKKTYGEIYQKTLQREQELKNAGYTIISIWESDWKNSKRK